MEVARLSGLEANLRKQSAFEQYFGAMGSKNGCWWQAYRRLRVWTLAGLLRTRMQPGSVWELRALAWLPHWALVLISCR